MPAVAALKKVAKMDDDGDNQDVHETTTTSFMLDPTGTSQKAFKTTPTRTPSGFNPIKTGQNAGFEMKFVDAVGARLDEFGDRLRDLVGGGGSITPERNATLDILMIGFAGVFVIFAMDAITKIVKNN
jgi:hypothetical protein